MSASVVARGYDYPAAGRIAELERALDDSGSRGVVRHRMMDFLGAVEPLSLAEWEELHTRTLDLSPAFVPYVGHVQWGENYRRGEFMADLNRVMTVEGIDRQGELPDHIAAVLRYIAVAVEPLPDLVEVLPATVSEMQSTLAGADRHNPYRHLLAATMGVVEDLRTVSIGGGR